MAHKLARRKAETCKPLRRTQLNQQPVVAAQFLPDWLRSVYSFPIRECHRWAARFFRFCLFVDAEPRFFPEPHFFAHTTVGLFLSTPNFPGFRRNSDVRDFQWFPVVQG